LDPVFREEPETLPVEFVWQRPRKFRDRIWLHVFLFVATVVTTTLAGGGHYASFITDFGTHRLNLSDGELLLGGLWYSATILAILGCHELGHYFACRYYDVDASLPYFLPLPFPLTGTLGAVIRIREPIPSKRMLFDIGIAGPIAGFLVAVPALFIGLWLSRVAVFPTDMDGLSLGEPLLFKLGAWLVWGTIPNDYTLNLHPMAFAAWFGMLATALNLFPIGQLDGGHISYAVLGRRSSQVTIAMVGTAVALTFVSMSWLVWTIVTIVMLYKFGRHHPPTFDENVPLDWSRRLLAVFAVIMFALCFTPAPIQPLDLLR
jgi:membrane-associated protease RseP (regulator of RpoE activity)